MVSIPGCALLCALEDPTYKIGQLDKIVYRWSGHIGRYVGGECEGEVYACLSRDNVTKR
jgi:hypothetical protein